MAWEGYGMAEKLTPEAIKQAQDITPDDVLDIEAILSDLAKLTLPEYDQCRKDKAKLHKMRVGTLDAEVAKRRLPAAQPDAQGTQVLFEDPQPWHLEIKGADLLTALATVYRERIILPD